MKMPQLTINPISTLKNYHDCICGASVPVNNRLVEEIERFVVAHRQHWSSSDLPVLISLSSRLKKLTGEDSPMSSLMNSILILKDSPVTDRARQALYQLLSTVLAGKSFQNQDFVKEIRELWNITRSSENFFGSGEYNGPQKIDSCLSYILC